MTSTKSRTIRHIRIIVQTLFLLCFVVLFFYPTTSSLKGLRYTSIFFYFDSLIFISKIIITGKIIPLFLFSLIPVILTLFLGRFFCGWVCPMGAINQFFSWLFRKSKQARQPFNKSHLKIKYYILVFVLVSSVAGMNIAGWLDPFSILTRSIATISPAGEYLEERTLTIIRSDRENRTIAVPTTNETTSPKKLRDFNRSSGQSLLIGGFFLLIIWLNHHHRRFFCNIICPLGAIYGLFSRFGFFQIKTVNTCNSCDVCSKGCTYQGNAGDRYLKSDCLSCFNCFADCPSGSVKIKIELPRKNNHTPIELGRRKMFLTLGAGIAMASLSKIQLFSKPKQRHNFLRPPGAIGEDEFLKKCSNCGQCTQSCPTSFIQPAFLDTGIEGLWTPIASAKAGYCIYECNRCTQVCPTGAIEKISLKEKQNFKIGLAAIDKNRCYTYADGINCTVCYDKCPTQEKAIAFKEAEVWNYKGRITTVKQIHVLSDICIGCGICEYACPRHDSPGIFIVSENEYREMNTDVF